MKTSTPCPNQFCFDKKKPRRYFLMSSLILLSAFVNFRFEPGSRFDSEIGFEIDSRVEPTTQKNIFDRVPTISFFTPVYAESNEKSKTDQDRKAKVEDQSPALKEPMSSEKDSVLSLSMFPGVAPLLLQQRYEPLIQYLNSSLDHDVVLKTRKNYQDYFSAVKSQMFDIVIINAFDFSRLRNETIYIPILIRDDSSVTVLISADEHLSTIEELTDKRIGFSPKESGVALMGEYLLRQNNLRPEDYHPVFFSNHLSCLQAIINKKIDACFIGQKMLDEFTRYRKINYREIVRSPQMPQQLIMVHPRRKELINNIKESLLALNDSEEGRSVLAQAYLFRVGEFDNSRYDINEKILAELQQLREE